MKSLIDQADEIPVTLVVAIAYVTLAFLTGLFGGTELMLDEYGAMTPLQVSEGEWWRLLAAAFLHGNLVHLGFNTWALVALGPAVERALGSLRMLSLYVVSALGGHLACCLVYAPGQSVVGGSGALFGIMGAIVAWQMQKAKSPLAFLDYEGPRRILGLIAVNIVLGLMVPYVSNTAHVGGLIAGFLVTYQWLVPSRETGAAGLRNHFRLAIAALFASITFHALMPVTRYDWLWNRHVTETDPDRRIRLRNAALMSWRGRTTITPADLLEFERLELR